jgi:GR25 family glycosyltransferase involved in LPS biosynthesis
MDLDKYVITTQRFCDRHESFQDINKHISNFKWVYGIDAKDYVDSQSIHDEFPHIVDSNLPWLKSIICNALSHYTLIKECAEGNKIMTIMEDDAVLVEDFDQKAINLINSLADSEFDLIQWGWNWDSFVFIKDNMGVATKIDWSGRYLKEDPLEFKKSNSESTLEPLLHTFGSHCYSLTPQGARKLLGFIPVIQDMFVDNVELTGIAYRVETFDGVFNAFYPEMKAFISIAPLSFVTNDKSKSVL